MGNYNSDDLEIKASLSDDTFTEVSDESSPLMRTRRRPGLTDAEGNTSYLEAPSLSSSNKQRTAKSAWNDLGNRIDMGEFLLAGKTGADSSERSQSQYEEMREAAVNNIRSLMDFSLSQCLAAVILYIAVAVVVYSFLIDNMTVIDAMYYAVVTFTTIGYGDVVPITRTARLFTCFFALTGVAGLGIALGVIGNSVIEAQSAALEKAGKLSKQRALSLFNSPNEEPTSKRKNGSNVSEEESDPPLAITGVTLQRIGLEFVAVIALSLLFATLLSHDPSINAFGWRQLGDAAYFAIITATTVGYGDLAPASQQGRLLATFFIPVLVGAMGHWLSLVAGYIIESRQSRFHQQMANKELTMEDLDIMDEDGDGQVTQVEFLEFMLTAMNKVDRETLQNLRVYFRRLDADGTGTLSKEDLIASARRKVKMAKRKLELSSYKRSLLKTAAEASPAAKEEESDSFWTRFAV